MRHRIANAPRILATPPARSATVVIGMGILKDAILSFAIAVTAVIGAEGIGWAWYVLGLLWLGR
jgi:hypothetical protein